MKAISEATTHQGPCFEHQGHGIGIKFLMVASAKAKI